MMLVTQNYDDLHTKLIKESEIIAQSEDPYHLKSSITDNNRDAFQPHVYEIHGNMNFMHCSNEDAEHSQTLMRVPSLEEFDQAFAAAENKFDMVPKCPECGAPMKPHCMFFDEAYSEHYYRKDTVMSYLNSSDCLIVVGTAL